MNQTVKIYGNTVNTWKVFDPSKNREVPTQYEVEFTEYRTDGSIYRTGTEDFSVDRWNETIQSHFVWAWNGESRNKGGQRCFQYKGLIRYSKANRKAVNILLQFQHPEAELIQLRKW